MDTQSDSPIRFSLRGMLAVFAYVSFSLAVASYTQSIALGVGLSLALVGWLMWRYAHGHLGGIIPALLGGHVLVCTSIPWALYGAEDFLGFRIVLDAIASLIVIVGLGVLVWAGSKQQRYWKNQYGIALAILCILIFWWLAIPIVGNAVIARRQASDTAANNAAAAKAIALVEEVLKRTGAAPEKDALAKLLPEPLPSIRWAGNSYPIDYRQKDNSTYELSYIDPSIFWGDIITYDSATPQKGWYRIPF